MDRRSLFGATAMAAGLFWTDLARAAPPAPDVTVGLDALREGTSTVGGCIVAARGGQAVATYVWGSASLPFAVPVSDRTLFHIGSNAKLMTAVAVMQVTGAARINLDDPIGAHLPDLPPVMAAVPISNLLHHTSGLPDYVEHFPDWDRPQTRDLVSAAFTDRPLLFPTGGAWRYSNTNYLILGWLIEHLSGQSYGDYVRTRLFEPAGMPTARADAAQQVVPNRAEPYEIDDQGVVHHGVRMDDAVSRAADGGLLLSAQDVVPWRAALDRDRLISAEDMARVLSPAPLNSGRLAPYGFAVFLERTRGNPLQHHSGGVPGFVSNWLTWPEADLSVLGMVNSMGNDPAPLETMMLALAESIQPGISWVALAPAGDGSDIRTGKLRALFDRADGAPIPENLLAEEIVWLPADQLPRPRDLTELAPLEHWLVGDDPRQGEMVRYRATRPGEVREVVVGWTPDDKIYWI